MRESLRQIVRYSLVGIVNTVVGLTVIFFFMHIGFGDIFSNVAGYMCGFAVSCTINARWTFETRLNRYKVTKYMTVVVLAYVANLTALVLVRDFFELGRVLAQLAGICVYTLLGFVGSRYYAFKSE